MLLSACGSGNDETASDSGSTAAPVSTAGEAAVASEATLASAPAVSSPPRAEETPAVPESAPVAAGSEPTPAAEPATPPAAESAAPAATTESAPPVAGDAAPAPAASAATPANTAGNIPAETSGGAALSVLNAEEPALTPEMAAMIETGDAEAGHSYAQRCTGCHSFREEQQHGGAQEGPVLFGIFGAAAGAQRGFDYSPALQEMNDLGLVWTPARLNAFLADPTGAAPGTSMTLGGIADDQNRANVIAYLKTLAPAPDVAGNDPELLARIAAADPADGEALAAGRCASCHRFTSEGDTLFGPNLFNIVGGPVAAAAGFSYSLAFQTLNAEGAVWTVNRLDAFLENPAVAIPGTRMGFVGISDPDDRAAVIAYLRTLADTIAPLAGNELLGIGVARADLMPLTFTNSQRNSGALWYVQLTCDACHGPNLSGVAPPGGAGFIPPLVGQDFRNHWFGGTVNDLYAFLTGHAADVVQDDGQIALLLAYIFAGNGFVPGDVELPRDSGQLRQMGFFQ